MTSETVVLEIPGHLLDRSQPVEWLPAVQVTYMPATEHRESRIRFRNLQTGQRLFVPFQYRYHYTTFCAAVAETMLGQPVKGVWIPDNHIFVATGD